MNLVSLELIGLLQSTAAARCTQQLTSRYCRKLVFTGVNGREGMVIQFKTW